MAFALLHQLAFPASRFINPLHVHLVLERSTDKEWYNSSGTSSNGQGHLLEQITRVLATQKQEDLFVYD